MQHGARPRDATARAASTSSLDSPSLSPSPFPSYGGSDTQSLASILNNPLGDSSYSSSSWWGWPTSSPSFPDVLLAINSSSPLPDVPRSSFHPYLSLISDPFSKFQDVRAHQSQLDLDLDLDSSATPASSSDAAEIDARGDALVACLREVPSLFFKEDFALEDGATFRAACPPGEGAGPLQERLSQYLDVVEVHLVREISLRSASFYEAQGRLQGLEGEIVEACVRIGELKEAIRVLTGDLVDSARTVQELNATRGSLVALHRKLALILYVSQALSALKLLVTSADCAGALDVIDDLQQLQDSEELAGLHCFRHLRDQLANSINSVNSILSAEFMHVATLGAKDVDSMIMSKFRAKAPNANNGADEEVKLNEEESSVFRDRLLPLIIGLLRTAKLPYVLRIYRDALISDMKTSIKTAVAELLPVLRSRNTESDSTIMERTVEGDGGMSLASKLRNMSSESFVQLLVTIFKVVQSHLVRAAEVKRVIEWIMTSLDGCDTADSSAAAYPTAAATESSQDGDTRMLNSRTSPIQRSVPKIFLHGKANESSSPSTAKSFRADVLRENTEAVFSACDAAHGRWAKLLGVRALLHPKLKLHEFLSIYTITQDFITSTEKIGGRLGYSIRGTLQSQSKAFVDFQHDFRMAKIKAVLDQETWVSVDVPEEFQSIVDSFSSETLSSTDNALTVDSEVDNVKSSLESRLDNSKQVNPLASSSENHDEKKGISAKSMRNGDANVLEHGKSALQKILYRGVGYHMVNCGLILLKMLSEYVDVSKSLPTLSSEVVHRIVEFLKLFNTRTCQLVLGAGAMQVSGLKSITSKHLALASQLTSFVYVIIPDIRQVLFLKIPDARKGLLLAEIDRVAQDYRIHRDEIHSKLVQIMRERLLVNLRKFPQIVESWNGPEDNDPQPSQFARAVTKEVSYLHRILSQILLDTDVHRIFRQVVEIFHSHISEAFSNIEIKSPQCKTRLHRDVQHILDCIHKLPSDNSTSVPNFGLLDEFLEKNFGTKGQ